MRVVNPRQQRHGDRCMCSACYARNYPAASLAVRMYTSDEYEEIVRSTRPKPPQPVDVNREAELINRGHPSLLDIANREGQIMQWEIDRERGNRLRHSFWLGPLVMALGIALIALTGFKGFIFLVVVGAFVWPLAIFRQGFHESRPEHLAIVKFTPAENSFLRQYQDREPFRAVCACPGCGDVDTHPFMETTDRVPEWAAVIRKCATCDREWGQS